MKYTLIIFFLAYIMSWSSVAGESSSTETDYSDSNLQVMDEHGTNRWQNATSHGDGWFSLPWFGWFQDYVHWIYHLEQGWWFVSGENTSSIFIYDFAMDLWGWSAEGNYPWIYWFDPVSSWSVYERGGSPGQRRFFHVNANLWRHESALRGPVDVAPAQMVSIEGGALPASSDLGELNVASFLLQNYEVTWSQWNQVRAWAVDNGYDIGPGQGCADDHPVFWVSWLDAVKWANARSEMEGLTPAYTQDGEIFRVGHHIPEWNTAANGYRLPTDAEWEFAARGATHSQGFQYSGGNDPDEVAWHWGNTFETTCVIDESRGTAPVAQKRANEVGLYDMSGNVWEWCWDADLEDVRRHIRGGSWLSDETSVEQGAFFAKVSSRAARHPDYLSLAGGFRVARNSD